MADDELVTSTTPTTDTHKRKLELNNAPDPVTESDPDPDSVSDGTENGGVDESDAKRQRLDINGDNVEEPVGAVAQNGHEEEQKKEAEEEDPKEDPETVDSSTVAVEGQEVEKEASTAVTDEEKMDVGVTVRTDVEETKQDVGQTEADVGIHSEGLPKEGDVAVLVADMEPGSENQVLSRRIEVPNDKVGVLIGKAGDTIRSLQDNSGAKIQIVRDADADPHATTRPIELVGTVQNINRAEKLIKDVIAEADAGGSPSLVARGFGYTSAGASGEQVEIQVPIEKVGLIIGKGGETIRNLQTRSGARIQLIQINPSDGNSSGERTVRITGHKKQIDNARELIKDVMNQTVRPSPLSGAHNQHGYRPRGQASPQWGPRGPHPQFSGYNNYPQRGPYPSHGSQYPPPTYGNYHPQQGPRGNFGPNWEQRPPTMHGPSAQGNYNYGQQQGPDYGNPPPYAQQPPPAQPYGHQGYNEVKYDHHASSQPYGQMATQPTPYAQGGPQPGYGQQDQYGKPPMYGQPPQSQPYVQQPRPTSQPGEVPYQGPVPSTQPPYAQNPPPQQQSYSHAPTGPIQQNYPPPQAGQPVATGYNQPQPGAAYPQQQAPGGYGSYPTAAQYGYPEQQAATANTAAYGYQDPNATYGAAAQGAHPPPAAGQAGYGQPAAGQYPVPTYDQSGGYGSAPVAAAAAAPTVSPLPAAYPQYDATGQMYGAHR